MTVKIKIKYKFKNKGIEDVISGKKVLEDEVISETKEYTLDWDKPKGIAKVYHEVVRVFQELLKKTEKYDNARIEVRIRK